MEASIKKFNYLKESGELKGYELLQLKDMGTAIEGISLGELKEEDKKEIISIQEEYLKAIQKYMNHYRRFNKVGIKEIK
jgi:hypothetical protein